MGSRIVLLMKTIDITLDQAARDLAGVIRRLREIGGCVVLMDDGGPVAEITLVAQSKAASADETQSIRAAKSDEESDEWTGPREVRSDTGLWVVARKPGQRIVTSEEIYEELRGSGP